jgi:hypothetical protein
MTGWRVLGGSVLVCVLSILSICGIVLFTTAVAAASPPTVTFDAPINESTSTVTNAEITIADGTLTISGSASDPDGISHLTVARAYRYHDAEDDGRGTEIDRYYASPQVEGETFSHPVALGTGRNELNISVVDETGTPTTLDLVVHVNDTEAPTTHRLTATRDGEWVHVEGWIRDNVQVDTVRANGQTIQVQTGTRDLDREEVRLDARVPRSGGENLTVTVVDVAGNSREVVLPLSESTATPTETPAPTATATATATPEGTNATPTGVSTVTATPEPTETPAPSGGGGWGIGRIVGAVVVVGGGLLLVSSVMGGGW